eukprot:2717209-Pyramimonas_sp.AAC.1
MMQRRILVHLVRHGGERRHALPLRARELGRPPPRQIVVENRTAVPLENAAAAPAVVALALRP